MTSPKVPVVEGLFTLIEDEIDLSGCRCAGCTSIYFPASPSCRNPRCDTKQVESLSFGRSGILFSWTQHVYPPPAPFRMDSWAPHLIALVDLPEGLRVMGMLIDCDTEDVQIGMPVELTTASLFRDGQDRDVVTYAYRPAKQDPTSTQERVA